MQYLLVKIAQGMFFGGGSLIGGEQGLPVAVSNISSGIYFQPIHDEKKQQIMHVNYECFRLLLLFSPLPQIKFSYFSYHARSNHFYFAFQMLLSSTWSMRGGWKNIIGSRVSYEQQYKSICQRTNFGYLLKIVWHTMTRRWTLKAWWPKPTCSILFPACGRLQPNDASCGWVDSSLLNSSRYSIWIIICCFQININNITSNSKLFQVSKTLQKYHLGKEIKRWRSIWKDAWKRKYQKNPCAWIRSIANTSS